MAKLYLTVRVVCTRFNQGYSLHAIHVIFFLLFVMIIECSPCFDVHAVQLTHDLKFHGNKVMDLLKYYIENITIFKY